MNKYRCWVEARDESNRTVKNFGQVEVDSKDEESARQDAIDKVWDDRLTAASCKPEVSLVKLTKFIARREVDSSAIVWAENEDEAQEKAEVLTEAEWSDPGTTIEVEEEG